MEKSARENQINLWEHKMQSTNSNWKQNEKLMSPTHNSETIIL